MISASGRFCWGDGHTTLLRGLALSENTTSPTRQRDAMYGLFLVCLLAVTFSALRFIG